MYTVEATPQYLREFKKLGREIQLRVDEHVQRLGIDPHHPSLRTHKRRGEDNVWQARVTRNYRLYFSMEGDVITLFGVGPHE